VVDAFRQQLRAYPGGGAVCVYHEGECVVDLWGGARDRAGRPWSADTMSPSFSTTKGVASTLVHMMVDRGLLSYDDPVARHWPEFAQAGKERIRVRHVLAHQSGLYHIRRMIDRADRMLDWDHMVRVIEAARPIHPPGARTGYHGLTYGFLVGELLQRVTGRRFADLVREELAVPLELDGFYVGAPAEALPRAAELIWPSRPFLGTRLPLPPDEGVAGRVSLAVAAGVQRAVRLVGVQLHLVSLLDALAPRGISSFDFGAAETLRAAIPAANGLFTARSLARLYAALACGGELGGVRLLSLRTLRRATEVQEEAPRRVVIPFDMRWRLGYHGVVTSRGVPRAAFGHFGFGGSGGWADPRRRLAVALIVNGGMGTPFGDLRIVRMGGAALAGAERRRRSWLPASAVAGAAQRRRREAMRRRGGALSS
jgi:CubicO group peptidase (beta-lactamase class C family)